jgi:hypothetical protein
VNLRVIKEIYNNVFELKRTYSEFLISWSIRASKKIGGGVTVQPRPKNRRILQKVSSDVLLLDTKSGIYMSIFRQRYRFSNVSQRSKNVLFVLHSVVLFLTFLGPPVYLVCENVRCCDQDIHDSSFFLIKTRSSMIESHSKNEKHGMKSKLQTMLRKVYSVFIVPNTAAFVTHPSQ